MNKIPFIAVEGPIGVGKSSLAKYIAQTFDFQLLKEIVEENPFLSKFYDDVEEWAFQTEMFFLCNRHKQIDDIKKKYLNQNIPVVSDYHILKNKIFAQMTLSEEENIKYGKIYDILTDDMPEPNLIIYLNASVDTLLKRIQFRGRSFEENFNPQYLERLSKDYDTYMSEFIKQHPDIPVLYFDGDEIDFVNNREHLSYILKEIQKYL